MIFWNFSEYLLLTVLASLPVQEEKEEKITWLTKQTNTCKANG